MRTLLLVWVCIGFPLAASAQRVTLSIAGGTALDASIDAASTSAVPLELTGSLELDLALAPVAPFGLVATSVEVGGGPLDADDVEWSLSDALASIDASLEAAAVGFSSPQVATTPIAPNMAEFPLPAVDVAIEEGLFLAEGSSIGVAVDVSREFADDPAAVVIGGPATIVTTPGKGAEVQVVLTLPVATALPLSSSSCVPWMQLAGTIVLRGRIDDSDADGVVDPEDNCTEVANPDQQDFDAGQDDDSSKQGVQHYGDACDVDLDDDGLVGASDFFSVLRPCLGANLAAQPECVEADLDGDGIVAASDFFGAFRPALGTTPGPGVGEP